MRFHNLQLLRVAAAVGVVVYHLAVYAQAHFGVTGPLLDLLRTGSWSAFPVPLFFALSGFVLTHAVRTARPGRFLLARAVRLYPGFWVATLLFSLAMLLTGWPDGLPLRTRLVWVGWTLRPHEYGGCLYVLGVEWSLVYEVMLSAAVAGMSLLGVRRGLPLAAAAWLAVLGVKAILWPGYATDPFPTWKTIALSGFNVPFLLGVLAYYLRDRGHRWRWVVFVATAAFLITVPGRLKTLEGLWLAYGAASAAAVWFAVQVRQVNETNLLARLGDCTYGLYLAHVPVMIGAFALLGAGGRPLGPTAGVLVAGAAALVVGLLYGRFEAGLHARLRPLAKLTAADVRGWAAGVGFIPRLPGLRFVIRLWKGTGR